MEQNSLIKKLKEIVPKNGIVFNEKNEFSEVLCKPKLLPLKSYNIRKLEELEKNFEKINNEILNKNK